MAVSLCSVAIAAFALIAGAQAGFLSHYPDSSTVANKFMVTWTPVPGGLWKTVGFYDMPRTVSEAQKDHFTQVQDRTSIDGTTVWCRKDDYRVCALFDGKQSVAGLMVSGAIKELATAPLEIEKEPAWFRQNLLGVEVYSSISYFVSDAVLKAGGRTIDENTPTAPDGIRILETRTGSDATNGAAVSTTVSVDVPITETAAPGLGFTKQNCFIAMGQHYFQDLSPASKCENLRPYFLLYGKRTNSLLGYGVLQWGKLSRKSRVWYEQPNTMAIKMIAGSRPDCLTTWVNKYTLNSIHVFFVDKPWDISCCSLF